MIFHSSLVPLRSIVYTLASTGWYRHFAGRENLTRLFVTCYSFNSLFFQGGLLGSLTKAGSDLVAKGLVATNKAVDYVSVKLDETLQKHYGGSLTVVSLFVA